MPGIRYAAVRSTMRTMSAMMRLSSKSLGVYTAATPACCSICASSGGMMPPTTTGDVVEAGALQARDHVLHQRNMRARQDRQSDHMRALFAHRFDDLGRRQPDAFVDHIHAGVARAHRDLLGAVGMPVEAGLADHECQPPAELARDAVDVGAQLVEADGLVARGAADAGGRAKLAEAFTQGEAPFAGRDAGFGAGHRWPA